MNEDGIKLVVSGSRTLWETEDNRAKIFLMLCDTISKLEKRTGKKVIELVHGDCKTSPDMVAKEYARRYDIEEIRFPALWELHGKKAGMLRNKDMAQYGNTLVAFHDGSSNGTQNMIDEMTNYKKRVILFLLKP